MPTHNSLKGKKEFSILFNQGRLYRGKNINLMICDSANQTRATLFAICVSKKMGNAVKRNRIKRVTRAVMAEIKEPIITGKNIALMPLKSFIDCGFVEMINQVRAVLQQAQIMLINHKK